MPTLNGTKETLQSYSWMISFLLILLLGAISWWLIGVEKRVTINAEHINELKAARAKTEERGEAILKQLFQIDNKLTIIDNRVYMLFGARQRGDMSP